MCRKHVHTVLRRGVMFIMCHLMWWPKSRPTFHRAHSQPSNSLAVIRMIIEGGRSNSRNVPRTQCVDLDWLFLRESMDTSISVGFVRTTEHLADVCTKCAIHNKSVEVFDAIVRRSCIAENRCQSQCFGIIMFCSLFPYHPVLHRTTRQHTSWRSDVAIILDVVSHGWWRGPVQLTEAPSSRVEHSSSRGENCLRCSEQEGANVD